jgi:sulfur carrier protein ThiS
MREVEEMINPIEFLVFRTSDPLEEEIVAFATIEELLQFVQSLDAEEVVLNINGAVYPTIEIYDDYRE